MPIDHGAADIKPDRIHAGMWRLQYPDGRLSDMTSLARAKDAAACFIETLDRCQRARQSPPAATPIASRERAATSPWMEAAE